MRPGFSSIYLADERGGLHSVLVKGMEEGLGLGGGHGDEQAAGSLGVEEEIGAGWIDVIGNGDFGFQETLVVAGARRRGPWRPVLSCALGPETLGCVKKHPHLTALGPFRGVSQKAEAGDVSAGVDGEGGQGFGGGLVEREHGGNCLG